MLQTWSMLWVGGDHRLQQKSRFLDVTVKAQQPQIKEIFMESVCLILPSLFCMLNSIR